MSSIRHGYVVRSNSWQFRPWTLSLFIAHTASRRGLRRSSHKSRVTFTAVLHQPSQPGVQLFQAPAVLGSHSSMQQPCHLCRGLAVLAAFFAICRAFICPCAFMQCMHLMVRSCTEAKMRPSSVWSLRDRHMHRSSLEVTPVRIIAR